MYSISSTMELTSLVMGSGLARTEHIFFLPSTFSIHVDSATMTVSIIVLAGATAFSLIHVETRAERE